MRVHSLVLLANLFFLIPAPPSHADDPSIDATLKAIEEKMPVYDAVEATSVQVPSSSMELGATTRMYRCWKLRLTGDHGKQVLSVLERVNSVHEAFKDVKSKLTKDVLLYAAALSPDTDLEEQIISRHQSLIALHKAYSQLIQAGERNKLLKSGKKGLFRSRQVVSPILEDGDYTMTYDDTNPQCATTPS